MVAFGDFWFVSLRLRVNTQIPKHISFVLDGNRRWAKAHGVSTLEGHLKGLDTVFSIIQWSSQAGVQYLTTYAFSTENWTRTAEELGYLFTVVFDQGLRKYLPQLIADNVKVNLFGDLEKFPDSMQSGIREVLDKTANNTGLIWNLCLDYGGRAELVRAVRKIVLDNIPAEKIDEATIADRLYSAGMPDPDLMIRTGGEQRLSNFLLWQHAYTEFYCPEVGLPGFTRQDFNQALEWYANRDRRYGK